MPSFGPENSIYPFKDFANHDAILVDGFSYTQEFLYHTSPYLCTILGLPKVTGYGPILIGHKEADKYIKQLQHWVIELTHRWHMMKSIKESPTYPEYYKPLTPLNWSGGLQSFMKWCFQFGYTRPQKNHVVRFFEKEVWHRPYESMRSEFHDILIDGIPYYTLVDETQTEVYKFIEEHLNSGVLSMSKAMEILETNKPTWEELKKILTQTPEPANVYEWYQQSYYYHNRPQESVPGFGTVELEVNIVGGPRDGEIIPWTPTAKDQLEGPINLLASVEPKPSPSTIPTATKVFRFRIHQTRPTKFWWLGRYEIRWSEREEVKS